MRLLATVYLEWDIERFQEKALNAVSLANKVGCDILLYICSLHKKQSESNDVAVCQECVSTSGLFLKIRILLRCGASDDHIKAG